MIIREDKVIYRNWSAGASFAAAIGALIIWPSAGTLFGASAGIAFSFLNYYFWRQLAGHILGLRRLTNKKLLLLLLLKITFLCLLFLALYRLAVEAAIVFVLVFVAHTLGASLGLGARSFLAKKR